MKKVKKEAATPPANDPPVNAQTDDTKTLKNSDSSGAKENVRDIMVWGDEDIWKLISKAFSNREGWMKSTKAMNVAGTPGGVLVQVTTQQGHQVAEALSWVPRGEIIDHKDPSGVVISREIVTR